MIQVEQVSKPFTRVYHTVGDIRTFALRVRLVDDAAPDEEEDIATLRWQQKRFSALERERYEHAADCRSELELAYHAQLAKEAPRRARTLRSIIFTYVQRDERKPSPAVEETSEQRLAELVRDLRLTSSDGDDDCKPFDYFEHLRASCECAVVVPSAADEPDVESFHVMADFGERYETTWLAAEHTLCTLHYSARRRVLTMTPDFTMFGPHQVRVSSDATRTFRYYLENASLDTLAAPSAPIAHQLEEEEEVVLWHTPPTDAIRLHIVLEILAGWEFDHDNIFVRYHLAETEDWRVEDGGAAQNLCGVTVASRASAGDRLHFGCVAEWHLIGANLDDECRVGRDPVVHFEVISKDTWQRFRSEGVTHLPLPARLLGRRTCQLRCTRTTSSSPITNELRRFFIGDCANYVSHANQATSNRMATTTISAGVLEVRVGVLRSGARATTADVTLDAGSRHLRAVRVRERLRGPRLAKTVDEAVAAFERARGALSEARDAATTSTKKKIS